jgi:purine-binding chemotaxis protein CheW
MFFYFLIILKYGDEFMAGYEQQTDEETDTQQGRYLTFDVGREVYGIEIRCVREIVGIQEISSIPECSNYVKGIINLRGNIIPVMDMRLRLKKKPIDYNDRTCIIVIEISDVMYGLIVDSVAEVITIDEANISAPPQLNSGTQYSYINGIGKINNSIKLLLNCEKLMLQENLEELIEDGIPVAARTLLKESNVPAH